MALPSSPDGPSLRTHFALALMRLLLLCLSAATLLTACSSSDPLDDPSDALVIGPIAEITPSGVNMRLLVEAGPGSNEPCGIWATVDAETDYFRRDGDALIPLGTGPSGAEQVEVGDTVEVYVDGAVAESCPVQGRASSLVLLTE